MNKFIIAAIASLAVFSTSAHAATVVSVPGSNANFVPPAGATSTFNGGSLATGFTRTGGAIQNGSVSGQYAQPAFSDGSDFLNVLGGASSTLQSSTGYNAVSFFWGSIDTYNTVHILDVLGNTIASFVGNDPLIIAPANGNQTASNNNRFVTFTRSGSDAAFGGIRFASTGNSFELDNVSFQSPVPEPMTWMMLIAGFGMMGFAMRKRSSKGLATA
ncbi:MAG: PEPxxWA-CTERM sorting domain-containing protein [Chakrabartia sp.]